MTITHTRHETPNHDGPIYLAEWQARCPELEKIREQGHRAAHLLSDINGMTEGPQSCEAAIYVAMFCCLLTVAACASAECA